MPDVERSETPSCPDEVGKGGEQRKCRFCGRGLGKKPYFKDRCIAPVHCRDRLASQLAEQAKQLAGVRGELEAQESFGVIQANLIKGKNAEIAACFTTCSAIAETAEALREMLEQFILNEDAPKEEHYRQAAALLAQPPAEKAPEKGGE